MWEENKEIRDRFLVWEENEEIRLESMILDQMGKLRGPGSPERILILGESKEIKKRTC